MHETSHESVSFDGAIVICQGGVGGRTFSHSLPMTKMEVASEYAPSSMPSLGRSNLTVLLRILVAQAGFALWSGFIATPVERTFEQAATEQVVQEARPSVEILVDQIIFSESQGDPTAKNKRSTAMGAGQFVEATWLELIRAHYPDLLATRTEKEVLNLRSDLALSREMTKRFIERNATALAKRGLPVTPSSLYLAHFAGPAGAAAILTSPSDADAATVIADADARPEVTRTKIINGNPFLRGFTVEDLKAWADLKTEGLASR